MTDDKPRASGGPVDPGAIYRLGRGDEKEVYTPGNNVYLTPSDSAPIPLIEDIFNIDDPQIPHFPSRGL